MISIRGCLLGGAVGDALGYAVEFLQEETIFEKYGDGGIREYDTGIKDVAMISDDTQMTLFTAAGLLLLGTCLSDAAGHRECPGTIKSPLNFSKGCGSVMRGCFNRIAF